MDSSALRSADARLYGQNTTVQATASPWEKQAWIVRVSRALRAGRGLDPARPEEKMEVLLPLPREEIIDVLMAHPAFAEGALDFNLYFLGAKIDRLRDESGNFDSFLFEFPQALASARALLDLPGRSDYLSLLDYRQPFYVGLLRRPGSPDLEDAKLTPAELRAKFMATIQTRFATLLVSFQEHPEIPVAQGCQDLLNAVNQSPNFFVLGLPNGMITALFDSQGSWFRPALLLCFSSPPPLGPSAPLIPILKRIVEGNAVFFQRIKAHEAAHPSSNSLADIGTFDFSDLIPEFESNQFGPTLAQKLVNSSTNFNRKRAAFLLKRFFCDDLTPIAVETPTQHAGDRHGSDPACLACHYKLDPMAGFFKDRGISFNDFSTSKWIQFDDQTVLDRETYVANWRAPLGANRPWDIGFIRSTNDPALNEYGENLKDLFAIIRRAPETRACLVRRMFEYYVGEDRTRDPAFLANLSQEFIENTTATTSAQAFRKTVKRLVLSASFAVLDPVPGVCYDRAPGHGTEGGPPCQVAYLLEKNCVSCHSSGGAAGLDLSRWEIRPDGRFGFPHEGPGGTARPARETFAAIAARLSSTDPDHRMPLGGWMDALEREQLYLWAHEQEGAGPGLSPARSAR